MRSLSLQEIPSVSGAEFIADTSYQWTLPAPPPSSDPVAIALQAVNAAVWGCIGGAIRGGVPGCVIGGVIGAAGKTVSMLVEDAYDSYWNAQQKA